MPILHQNGFMTIVAHPDDDLLFMNPDIANSIAAGDVSTTVYLTSGDAGGEAAYWQGRETGIKAAYALMAGSDDWVDEIVPIVHNDSQFDLVSSFLESAPEVRLYFLRIPDGAGLIEDPLDYDSLGQLEIGTRLSVDSVDGQASYTREDLVNVLTGLMQAHEPAAFRLQVSDGESAIGEHTDHIHTTEFALEGLDGFQGANDYHVHHYVNYQTEDMEPNLTQAEALFSLQVMQAYGAHDPAVTDSNGNLLPVYVEWSMRQYIDESYLASEVAQDPEPPILSTFTLGDHPDNFYFEIDQTTGEITTKDWFVPSLLDAWDADEDYVYEVTRIETPIDGTPARSELIRYGTEAEGVLVVLDGTAPTDDDPVDDGPGDDDPVIDDPVDNPDDPPAEDPQVVQSTFSLGEHPDNFYFEVDAISGEITTKDWFVPSLLDAWDADEDYIYEVTRIETFSDGSEASSEHIRYDTEAEGILTVLEGSDPAEDPAVDDPIVDDPIVDDPVVDDPVGDDPEPEGDPPADPAPTVIYELSGPDAFLFEIVDAHGAISPKDWFVPDFRDSWDQDENNVYEVTRTGMDETGAAVSRSFITFEVNRDDALTLVSVNDDLLLPLMTTGATEAGEAEIETDLAAEEDLLPV